jgi:glycosyltransferase involved in cell wall biosynthesis
MAARADVVLHNQFGLRLAWPMLATPTPWVALHHTWLPRDGRGAQAADLKRRLLRRALQVAVSRPLADSVAPDCLVLPNPYDDRLFRARPETRRDSDLLFVGRLVSDKGAALLLQALDLLQRRGTTLRLTVAGSGPELPALRRQALALGLAERVRFVGALQGEDLARAYAGHKVLAVPSVWDEPFGLVVLEALACGCLPVVADSGALPQAAGPCGLVASRGDPAAWADALARAVADNALRARRLAGAAAHLAPHGRDAAAAAHLDLLAHAARRRRQDRAGRVAAAPRRTGAGR